MVSTLEGALEKRQGQVGTCEEDGCPYYGNGILIDKKNSKMGGHLALDGCRLMGGHNNQPKVSINGGRGIEEERQPGRNVWRGVVSLLGAANRRRKKTTTEICHGLRWPPMKENHTTTNQKHAGVMKEVKEGSCYCRGERGVRANRLFGGDQVR
jgi:hypothetical protein